MIDQEIVDTMGIPGLYTEESSWFFTTTKAVGKITTKELHLDQGVHKLQFIGKYLPSTLQMDSVLFVLEKADKPTSLENISSRGITISQDGKGEFLLSGAQGDETMYVYTPQAELLESRRLLNGETKFGGNYRKGIYIIRIVGNEFSHTLKVIKE